jgi:hypothetical protein
MMPPSNQTAAMLAGLFPTMKHSMAADSKVTAKVQHISAHHAWVQQHRAMMAPAAASFHFPSRMGLPGSLRVWYPNPTDM